MKKLAFVLAFLLYNSVFLYAQNKVLAPKIDERLELLNIIYYLATPNSAVSQTNPYYFDKVATYFAKHKHHACVAYLRELIGKYAKDSIDLKDWELPSLAFHLKQEKKFEPFANMSSSPDSWDDKTLLIQEFIRLVNDFYLDTKAAVFFQSQGKYFKSIEQGFIATQVTIQAKWVENFFGIAPTEQYFPVQGLLATNGAYLRTNFANNQRHTHTLFTCKQFDKQGIPQDVQVGYYKWAMLHEYIHCYSNQIIENDTLHWKPIGEKLLALPAVNEKVKNTFYGNWRYLLYESLVRATAIRYAIAQKESTEKINEDIARQQQAGFLWMSDLVNSLGLYEQNRGKYKDVGSYQNSLLQLFQTWQQD